MKRIIVFMLCLLVPIFVFAGGKAEEAPAAEPAEAFEPVEPGEILAYNAREYEQQTGKKLEYQEAPMLKAMVASGEILPLKERLPEEPLVVKPGEEIGKYGGALRLIMPMNFRMDFGFEFLVTWTADVNDKYSNVLKGFEGNEDATKFTLYLRKGLRWSDGHPFTADDLMFWYEDVALNEELSPSVPSRFTIKGKPGVMRRIDDYTVEVSFPEPYAFFIENLARFRANPYRPKHYLKQFHPNYTPMAEIEKVMKKEGFESWVALFNAKDGEWDPWKNPERPTMSAFIPQSEPSEPLQIHVRNPYYFKVDTEGNQLPYVDKLEFTLVDNQEAKLLKALANEIDLINGYYLGGTANYSLLMQNKERGGNYRLIPQVAGEAYGANRGSVGFNMSHKDPVLKKLLNDKRFRIALSVGINREEINEFIFKGKGLPGHLKVGYWGPPYYPEKLFQDYLKYDPQMADRLLDEIGLNKRDKDGFRLRSDGKRLRLVHHVTGEQNMEIAEMYKEYWKEIGIEVVNKPLIQELTKAVKESADYDLITIGGGRGNLTGPQNMLTVRAAMPMDVGFNTAPQWGLWIATNGEKGEEPPEDIKRISKLQSQAVGISDEEKRIALSLEICKIFEKNFWDMGGVYSPASGGFWLVHNRVGNATKKPGVLIYGELNYGISAQLFIKE